MNEFAQAAAFQAMGHSGSVIGGSASGIGAQVSVPELTHATDRARETCARLNNTYESLIHHLNRILGTEPENADENGIKVGEPDCAMSALRNALSDLGVVERRLSAQVDRLARL